MWNLPAPPGFQGLHPDKPLTLYERHLPHWRQEGATYFLTFRLEDSLPQEKLREIARLRTEWERRHPPPRTDAVLQQLAREIAGRVERWLDQGMGACVLKDASLAALVTKQMHFFDGSRYELGSYVVMPNHVHAIVRPTECVTYPLETITGGWKQFSSRYINEATGSGGELWQCETFDRIIRDEEHLYRALQYIGRNPEKAGLAREDCPMWIRPEWEALGWTFEWRRASS